jgi:hypothetical protein
MSTIGFLGAAECLLFIGIVSGTIGIMPGILVHVLSVATAACRLKRDLTGDKAEWVIGLLASAVAGPLGCICILALALRKRQAAASRDLLAAWYQWLARDYARDPADQIYDLISTGRQVRTDFAKPRRFITVLEQGTLAEKQALLSLIALRYHKDYFCILGLALRNNEACVRAQAAAVFVKIKEGFNTRLNSIVTSVAAWTSTNPTEALARANAILDCTESGFIDTASAHSAHTLAKTLCKWAIASGPTHGMAEALLCRVLAAEGEHIELVHFFQSTAATLDANARMLVANSMMALNSYRELHDLLRSVNRDYTSPDQPIVAVT